MLNSGWSMAKHVERLSSGLRINHASDDPSGKHLSSLIDARIRGEHVAIRNLEEAHNMLATADGSLNEISDIMHRMRDICVRAASDALLTSAQRDSMQTELDALKKEITKIAVLTSFNTKRLIGPSEDLPASEAPSLENGRLTVTQNTVLAGQPFYEDLKQSMIHMATGAAEMCFGMLDLPVSDSLKLQLHFSDMPPAVPNECIRTTYPAADTIRMEVNLAYFTPQAPFTYSIFGNDSQSAMTTEMAFAYNFAQGVTVMKGLNQANPNHLWAIYGLTVYLARCNDRIIEWNPAAVTAAIAGSLISNPVTGPINPITKTGVQQFAETGLAFQFIAENFGNDKIRDMIDYAVLGNTFQSAVTKYLPQYTTFAQFEAAADAWSLDYINTGKYKNIFIGLGRTLATPRSDSPQIILTCQTGTESTDRYDIPLQWLCTGSLDYLGFAGAMTADTARRSIDTIDTALQQMATARTSLGVTMANFREMIDQANTEAANLSNMKSRITDADFAQEMCEVAADQLKLAGAALALSSDFRTDNARALLNKSFFDKPVSPSPVRSPLNV